MSTDLVALSKLLAYVLRHNPGAVGVRLDEAGWIDVDTLLDALAAHGRPTDEATLHRLAAGTDKRRFEIVGSRIRAAQGHSVPVDLGLEPAVPPPVLYHGTVRRFLDGIRASGLLPRGRHHVHLSATPETASIVGARRGDPVVLTIDAAAMHRDGAVFYRAANGVWLTALVPPDRITYPA
jgi:putative RNA 2'-phosphotransferase